MAKKKSQIPDNETPEKRFKRVVEPRVGKAIKAIGLVGSVSGATYKVTEKDIANIETALTEALQKSMKRLGGTGDKASGFSL